MTARHRDQPVGPVEAPPSGSPHRAASTVGKATSAEDTCRVADGEGAGRGTRLAGPRDTPRSHRPRRHRAKPTARDLAWPVTALVVGLLLVVAAASLAIAAPAQLPDRVEVRWIDPAVTP